MKELKVLKSCLKKKIPITMSLFVSFLITGHIGYANIINDNSIINHVSINSSTILEKESTGSALSAFKYIGSSTTPIVSIINNVTNKGIIEGKVLTKEENSDYSFANGNGIIAFSFGKFVPKIESSIGDIINTGTISGHAEILGEKTESYTNSVSSWGEGSIIGNGNGIGSLAINETYNRGTNPNEIYTISKISNIKNTGVIKGQNITLGRNNGNGYAGALGSGNGISNLSAIYSSDRTLKSESSIGNIENIGYISGNVLVQGKTIIPSGHAEASAQAEHSGNGISVSSLYNGGKIQNLGSDSFITTTVGTIKNNGVIKGNVTVQGGNSYSFIHSSGNGVNLGVDYYSTTSKASTTIGNIYNTGLIQGEITITGERPFSYSSGNGINLGVDANKNNNVYNNTYNIKTIKNTGVIRGIQHSKLGNFYSCGNGISFGETDGGGKARLIENKGIIGGTNYAIRISELDKLENNGILYGKEITNSNIKNNLTNQGVTVKLNDSGEIESINIGNGGNITSEDGTIKTIINGSTNGDIGTTSTIQETQNDIYLAASKVNQTSNVIINGVGTTKGALVVDKNTTLNDSIVNGYNTSVFLENSHKLTATNTIFNGGGLKNDIAVIKGDTTNNSAELLGNSIINGATNLDKGDDILTIDNSVQINGILEGGDGNDTLNLGNKAAKADTNLNILHDINNFEQINTNGNITLFETTKVTGNGNIDIQSGNLTLRIDPTKKDSSGNIIGHALYENTGNISSSGGNLVLGLNGIGEKSQIAIGAGQLVSSVNNDWWSDKDHLKTNSSVLDAKLSEDGKIINVTVKESITLLPSIKNLHLDSVLYSKLDKVYKSIVSSGQLKALANTTLLEGKTEEQSIGALLSLLNQIYGNNPYAYTLKASRDSMKLFEDNMDYLTIKPLAGQSIVQGKAIYTGIKNDSSYKGNNYYGIDNGEVNYKTTTSTYGGLATYEYGLDNNTSIGLAFGGNNQDVKFQGTSKIENNSLYIGAFAKKEINNIKLKGGLGYQYTSSKVDRNISNGYNAFSTNEKYNVNGLNLFGEIKYVLKGDNGWTLEPKAKVSYYYVNQDEVKENYSPNNLALKMDKATNNTVDVEVGVDIAKEIQLKETKVKNIVSVGVVNTLGDRDKELHGNILGAKTEGSKFDVAAYKVPKVSGKVGYDIEVEKTNGMIYNAGVSLEFGKDYNRNVDVHLGIGYKF